MPYIDLTGDIPAVNQLDQAPPLRQQSEPALIVPLRSRALNQAIDIGKEHRSLAAQATRKDTTPKALFTLSITLFTAKFTLERNGGLLSKRYMRTYPKIIGKFDPVPFDIPTNEFPSHEALIKATIDVATSKEGVRAQTWKIIASTTAGQPSSICHFPSQAYDTKSLLRLLRSVNVKVTPPYKFSLNFLYEFSGGEEDDYLDAQDDNAPNLDQKKIDKGKGVAGSSKRKASASPSIKKEDARKGRRGGAQVKSEQAKEKDSINVGTSSKLPDVQENNDDQAIESDDLSALLMGDESEEDQGGEGRIDADLLESEENNAAPGPSKKQVVPLTTNTRNVKRS